MNSWMTQYPRAFPGERREPVPGWGFNPLLAGPRMIAVGDTAPLLSTTAEGANASIGQQVGAGLSSVKAAPYLYGAAAVGMGLLGALAAPAGKGAVGGVVGAAVGLVGAYFGIKFLMPPSTPYLVPGAVSTQKPQLDATTVTQITPPVVAPIGAVKTIAVTKVPASSDQATRLQVVRAAQDAANVFAKTGALEDAARTFTASMISYGPISAMPGAALPTVNTSSALIANAVADTLKRVDTTSADLITRNFTVDLGFDVVDAGTAAQNFATTLQASVPAALPVCGLIPPDWARMVPAGGSPVDWASQNNCALPSDWVKQLSW